jgi:PAS domain-containing protein
MENMRPAPAPRLFLLLPRNPRGASDSEHTKHLVAMAQKPLELILARNFLTSLSTPAFLVDESGALIFYNEAAGAMLGISFEESGRMTAEEWSRTLSPFGETGEPTPIEEREMTKALRRGRPAHGQFKIRSTKGEEYEIEATAMPIVAEGGQEGAMIFFWTRKSGDGE